MAAVLGALFLGRRFQCRRARNRCIRGRTRIRSTFLPPISEPKAPGEVVRTRRIDTWMYANSDGLRTLFDCLRIDW